MCSAVDQILFDNGLRKRFLSSPSSIGSSNSSLTSLLKSFIASKTPSVASQLSLSSLRWSSILLVISSSIRQPSDSTISLISMSSKRLSACIFVPSIDSFSPIIRCCFSWGSYFVYLYLARSLKIY